MKSQDRKADDGESMRVLIIFLALTSVRVSVNEGRKSFSIRSSMRTVSSKAFLCRCSFTTFT